MILRSKWSNPAVVRPNHSPGHALGTTSPKWKFPRTNVQWICFKQCSNTEHKSQFSNGTSSATSIHWFVRIFEKFHFFSSLLNSRRLQCFVLFLFSVVFCYFQHPKYFIDQILRRVRSAFIRRHYNKFRWLKMYLYHNNSMLAQSQLTTPQIVRSVYYLIREFTIIFPPQIEYFFDILIGFIFRAILGFVLVNANTHQFGPTSPSGQGLVGFSAFSAFYHHRFSFADSFNC